MEKKYQDKLDLINQELNQTYDSMLFYKEKCDTFNDVSIIIL